MGLRFWPRFLILLLTLEYFHSHHLLTHSAPFWNGSVIRGSKQNFCLRNIRISKKFTEEKGSLSIHLRMCNILPISSILHVCIIQNKDESSWMARMKLNVMQKICFRDRAVMTCVTAEKSRKDLVTEYLSAPYECTLIFILLILSYSLIQSIKQLALVLFHSDNQKDILFVE